MSIVGTSIAQSLAGAPGAERAARPIGPPKETEKVRKNGLHTRGEDDEEVDSVQVSDEARSLKDAADEETRQERRGHEAFPEHGHEIEPDEAEAVDEAEPARPQHIDIQA